MTAVIPITSSSNPHTCSSSTQPHWEERLICNFLVLKAVSEETICIRYGVYDAQNTIHKVFNVIEKAKKIENNRNKDLGIIDIGC